MKCPADRRIEAFLNAHFADLDLGEPLRLPADPLILHRHGIARALSLPEGETATAHRSSAPTACGTACCTIPGTTAARRKGPSTLPKAACRSRGQEGRPTTVFADLFRRAVDAAERFADLAVHGQPARAGAHVRVAAAAADRLPGGARRCRGKRWRSASSPRAAW